MQQSETIAKIAAAIVAAHADMPSVTKNASNPAFRSKFANLDGMIETAKPILAKHKLAIVQGSAAYSAGTLTIETMLLHDSGEWLMWPFTVPVEKATAQGIGSATTYCRRYALGAILDLSADEDDDGNEASKAPKSSRTPAKSATPVSDAVAGLEATRRQTEAKGQPITRESKLTWGKKEGEAIKDLPDDYLQWAIQPGRKFGPDTAAWQDAMHDELRKRERDGDEPIAGDGIEDAGRKVVSLSNDAGPGDLPDLGF